MEKDKNKNQTAAQVKAQKEFAQVANDITVMAGHLKMTKIGSAGASQLKPRDYLIAASNAVVALYIKRQSR